jgi:hypothetical protein
LEKVISDITQQLIASGIEIKRLAAAAEKGKLSISQAVTHAVEINKKYLPEGKNVIFVDSSITSKSSRMNGLLKKLTNAGKLSTEEEVETVENVETTVKEL